jgi:hypothetical protein
MKRLFILVPDLKEASDIVHELENSGFKQRHLHVCGHIPEEVSDAHLHPASVFQMTHLGSTLKLGPLVGLGFFVFIVALFMIVFPSTMHIPALGYLSMFAMGIIIGMWAMGLVGLGVKDPIVEKYEKYVQEGHFILMIDAPDEKEKEISESILSHHPDTNVAQNPENTVH